MTTADSPAQVADECEMLAQQECDDGDREAASLYLTPCHTIRHLLRTLARLNERVHSGYDFNADPDYMTLEVGEMLRDYTPPEKVNNPAQTPEGQRPGGCL